MKKVLSTIAYPALAGVVREQSKSAVIAEIRNCMYDGADKVFTNQYDGLPGDPRYDLCQTSKCKLHRFKGCEAGNCTGDLYGVV